MHYKTADKTWLFFARVPQKPSHLLISQMLTYSFQI